MAGKNLVCDFHTAKTKFFGSINSILGQITNRAPLQVSLSLLFAKCIPILLYGLEAIHLNGGSTRSLSQVYNSIFFKLCNSFDSKIIQYRQYYSGYLPFSYNIALRKINFFLDLKNGPACNTKFMFTWTGNSDLNDLLTKYNLNPGSSSDGICWQICKHFKTECNA